MEQVVLVTLVAVGGGVLLGALLAYLFMRSAASGREAQLRQELMGLQAFREEALALRSQAARLEQVEADRKRLQEEHAAARLEGERLSITLEKERQAHEQKLQELTAVRAQIEKDLRLLSEKLLHSTSESFLKRAREVFETQQKESRTGLEALVKPMSETLKAYQEKLAESEQVRKREIGR